MGGFRDILTTSNGLRFKGCDVSWQVGEKYFGKGCDFKFEKGVGRMF